MRCGAMPARSRTPRSSCRCPTRRSHLPSAPSGSSNTTRSHRCVSAGSSTEGRPARISALQLRPVRKVAYLPAMAQRSRFRFLAAIAVSSLVVAACGSDDDDGGTNDDSGGTDTVDSGDPATTEDEGADAAAGSVDELVIAIGGDETSLNPYTYVTGYPGWNLLGLIHDSLLVLDETNTARPLLATDWTTSDDGLVWTMSLRDDVTWHDGEAFDADDVAFTFDYVAEFVQSRWTPGVAAVDNVEVLSPTEVEITLTSASPDFAVRPLADMPILAEHVWADVDDPDNSGIEQNIGTGPYVIADYTVDQSYRLEANPDYAMGTPVAETVLLAVIPEPSTAFAALRAGEVDMVSSIVEPQLVAEFEADSELTVSSGPGFASTMLNINNERPPLDDPEVRRAIGLAIDPTELIDTVLLGTGTAPNPGFLHPEGPITRDAATHVFDPEQAASLLDDLGAEPGDDGVRVLDGEPMRFELLVYADSPSRIRSAEIISEQLDEVGIVAEVATLDAETVDEQIWPGFDVTNGRDYDLGMWGWSAPIQLDAGRFGALLHSDPTIGTLNVTGLDDPDIDTLVDQMAAAATPEERAEFVGALEALVTELRPFVMLYYQDGAYAYRPGTFDGWVYQNGQGP